MKFKVNENVQIDCIEGFGGEGHVVETKEDQYGNMYKCRMNGIKPGEGNYESWYHEWELTRMENPSCPRRRDFIVVHKSETADTRTCDFAKVTKETLLKSSIQHIDDVQRGLKFFQQMLFESAIKHDPDKLTDIDSFHADFLTGFKQTGWWDRHRRINRHHLSQDDGVPSDVNLVDVLDFITDCVMAGMARSGTVYEFELKPEVLQKAFDNTVDLLKQKVRVE